MLLVIHVVLKYGGAAEKFGFRELGAKFLYHVLGDGGLRVLVTWAYRFLLARKLDVYEWVFYGNLKIRLLIGTI